MKFLGYEVSGIPAGAAPGGVRVVDQFQIEQAAIQCARLLEASGQWRGVMCHSVTVDGESRTTYPVRFREEQPA